MILALSGGGATSGSGSTMLIMLVALFAIMYVFMIRPQKKEQKKMQEMLGSMEVGDAVMTTSGFYGIIIDISEEDVIVEFGNNKNCRIPMRKEAITRVEKPGQAVAPVEEKTEKGGLFKKKAKDDAAEGKAAAKSNDEAKSAWGEKK